MSHTLAQLAEIAGGRVLGDPALEIQDLKPLCEAGPGHLTFVEKPLQAAELLCTKAGAAILDEATLARLYELCAPGSPTAAHEGACSGYSPESLAARRLPLSVIVAKDSFWAFVNVALQLRGNVNRRALGVHPSAWVSPKARLGKDVNVYPGAFIDDDAEIGDRCEIHSGVSIGLGCRLGPDSVLHPNVVLYPGARLGQRVIIHAGSVIGADGFGYRTQGGRHVKVPQLGQVEIGDDVEIGACSAVDRATFGTTTIGEGTKIDNLVQVAHNCHLGKHNLLVAQSGFAGSCVTGDYVVAAGQAGIRDHVTIGRGARIGAQAGVMSNVPEGAQYIGSPATPEWEQKRLVTTVARLPEMRRNLRDLEKELSALRRTLAQANGQANRATPSAATIDDQAAHEAIPMHEA